MHFGFSTLALVLLLCQPVFTQIGPSPRAEEADRQRVEADLSRRMREMTLLDQKLRAVTQIPKAPLPEPKLSAEARERVINYRRVDRSELGPYGSLLANKRFGVFKIVPELNCISKNVVSASPQCANAILMSSAFSFRSNAYTDELYHDVHFDKGSLKTQSFFTQGIFSDIGDEPIESVTLDHPALKILRGMAAAADSKAASANAKQFAAGFDAGGFRFADNVEPKLDKTYLLRTIAYRLHNSLPPLTSETTLNEMMFHSLSFDKRHDMIVVFRLIKTDEYGGLTLIWKEISRTDAPKIRFAKGEPIRDFRQDN
jgi:hypothetical protein